MPPDAFANAEWTVQQVSVPAPRRRTRAAGSSAKSKGLPTTPELERELSPAYKDKVQRLSVDIKLKDRLGGQIALSQRQMKIIEYIQKTGYLQNKAFDTLFPMVSEDTILNELKVLVQNGIVKKQGVTKGAKYVMA